MNYFWVLVGSAFSISIPCILMMIRSGWIDLRYRPLAILLATGLINECLSFLMISQFGSNLVNSNIYTLAEFFLVLWLFSRLNGLRITSGYLLVISIGIGIWLIDNLLLHSLSTSNTLFRIGSSFVIVWLSMNSINNLVFAGRKTLYQRADLALGISFFIYYTYRTFIHTFNYIQSGSSSELAITLWLILGVLNIITNLGLCLAILWMPKRQTYTLS